MISLNATSPTRPETFVVSNFMISGFGIASVSKAASARTRPYPDFLSTLPVPDSSSLVCILVAVF